MWIGNSDAAMPLSILPLTLELGTFPSILPVALVLGTIVTCQVKSFTEHRVRLT